MNIGLAQTPFCGVCANHELICGKWFFDPAVLPRRKSRLGLFSRDCGIRAGSKEQVRATP